MLRAGVHERSLHISSSERPGVGKSLMRFIAAFAVEHGCTRFDWTAETTNPKAAKFYLALGASVVEEKQYFRLNNQGLAAFAMQDVHS